MKHIFQTILTAALIPFSCLMRLLNRQTPSDGQNPRFCPKSPTRPHQQYRSHPRFARADVAQHGPYRYAVQLGAAALLLPVFDCSGMIQFVYKNALGVSLPRTARDMAAASRKIPDSRLKAGDLVFFNTGGANKYSHVGLYIGNGEFIHAPSSGKTIKTEKLSSPFYAKNYLGAHTFFTD